MATFWSFCRNHVIKRFEIFRGSAWCDHFDIVGKHLVHIIQILKENFPCEVFCQTAMLVHLWIIMASTSISTDRVLAERMGNYLQNDGPAVFYIFLILRHRITAAPFHVFYC